MSKGDRDLLDLWKNGEVLERLSDLLGKTPTSLASKLVRLGIYACRKDVEEENTRRGGCAVVSPEKDGCYTIYLVKSPIDGKVVYIGQSQNFTKRIKAHQRKFANYFGGLTPVVEPSEVVAEYSEARHRERELIAKYVSAGHELINVQDRELCKDA